MFSSTSPCTGATASVEKVPSAGPVTSVRTMSRTTMSRNVGDRSAIAGNGAPGTDTKSASFWLVTPHSAFSPRMSMMRLLFESVPVRRMWVPSGEGRA